MKRGEIDNKCAQCCALSISYLKTRYPGIQLHRNYNHVFREMELLDFIFHIHIYISRSGLFLLIKYHFSLNQFQSL